MSKRLLSRSPLLSSSSSVPSQQLLRFQLLQKLPTALLSITCSFLTVRELLSILRSTCHALHDRVTASCYCQPRSHIQLDTTRSLPALLASPGSSRLLIGRISSLTIVHQCAEGQSGHYLSAPRLRELRFLFSSLSSLRVVLEDCDHCSAPWPCHQAQSFLDALVQMLGDEAASFSSLRRLDVDDIGLARCDCSWLTFAPLAGLWLTHCRIRMAQLSAQSSSSLVSALASLQSLTSLDFGKRVEGWAQLLQLLCADAAIPLLLRLKALSLPSDCQYRHADRRYDAFLCRLSSLPSPPALQHFSGYSLRYYAAGLLSLCSLPHLTSLQLKGWLQRSELSAFASSFTFAPAPLVSLAWPQIRTEPGDECGPMRPLLLSRFTGLRQLVCDAETSADADCQRLYSLKVLGLPSPQLCPFTVPHPRFRLARLPFTPPLSFPLLTELSVGLPLTDAELEQLLSACPQLLRLRCAAQRGWAVLLIAARHCPGLMQLSARIERDLVPDPTADVASPFLPQLLSLQLQARDANSLGKQRRQCVWQAALRPFLEPPHAQLLQVGLQGFTAEHVLSLACLPRLFHLEASKSAGTGDNIAPVEEARRRAQQQPLCTVPAMKAATCLAVVHSPEARMQLSENDVWQRPLGPHRQQEMRHRLLDEIMHDRGKASNVLAAAHGVDPDSARAAFFAELLAVVKEKKGSRASGSTRRG